MDIFWKWQQIDSFTNSLVICLILNTASPLIGTCSPRFPVGLVVALAPIWLRPPPPSDRPALVDGSDGSDSAGAGMSPPSTHDAELLPPTSRSAKFRSLPLSSDESIEKMNTSHYININKPAYWVTGCIYLLHTYLVIIICNVVPGSTNI